MAARLTITSTNLTNGRALVRIQDYPSGDLLASGYLEGDQEIHLQVAGQTQFTAQLVSVENSSHSFTEWSPTVNLTAIYGSDTTVVFRLTDPNDSLAILDAKFF